MKTDLTGTAPRNGTIQIKGGRMRLYVNDAWADFGIAYVATDMRRIARPKGRRRNGYAAVLARWALILEREGMRSIPRVQELIKPYFGSSEPWMAQDCRIWHGWLNQIWQLRNCAGKKDVPPRAEANKSFRDNYDTIFKITGRPDGIALTERG